MIKFNKILIINNNYARYNNSRYPYRNPRDFNYQAVMGALILFGAV